MFLFILESIGTSELILIAAVALIIFGPRKLPQMAKTLGKTISEFKNATNEFKTTWEKEVAFAENEVKGFGDIKPIAENQTPKTIDINQTNFQGQNESLFPAPAIKELSPSNIAAKQANIEQPLIIKENLSEAKVSDKREWL